MKRCVIHIGMHKTGSTSIQVSFCNHLNNTEWRYAKLGHANHSYVLAKILRQDLPGGDAAIGLGPLSYNEILGKLINGLEQEGENYLLSGEWLSGAVGVSKLTELRDLLLLHVDKVTIVGYVRSPKSYMESSFQQHLKMDTLKLNFTALCPRYRHRLEPFDLAFGKENVMLWKFDPATFKNHCVVQDFCDRLSIAFPEELIKRRNESLSREAIVFLYTYRKHINGNDDNKAFSAKENVKLVNCLAQLKGSKLRFASEVIKPVLDTNQADIQWMEQRMGEPLIEPFEDSADAIRSEEDLLRYQPEDLMWLAKQLGTEYVENCHPQMAPQEVAGWMLDLHLKLVANNSKVVLEAKVAKDIKPNLVNTRMGLKELVRHAKQNTPELEAVSDDHAIALLANVFKQINQNAKDINKGNLVVPGLGRFQINQIKHEKDGQTGLTKRLIFHAPNTKREEGV